MDKIKKILDKYKNHEIDYDQVLEQLNLPVFDDLGFAKVDHDRRTRTGFSEVIFGLGKTPSQICKIAQSILQKSDKLLITRVDRDVFKKVQLVSKDATFHAEAAPSPCSTVSGAAALWSVLSCYYYDSIMISLL